MSKLLIMLLSVGRAAALWHRADWVVLIRLLLFDAQLLQQRHARASAFETSDAKTVMRGCVPQADQTERIPRPLDEARQEEKKRFCTRARRKENFHRRRGSTSAGDALALIA